MADIVARLQALRDEIDKAKEAKARLEGQMETLLAKMKEQFKVDNVEAAEKKLREMRKEYEKMSASLEKGVAELEAQVAGD